MFALLAAELGPERVKREAPLAPFTTFRVGGPAECLVEVHDAAALAGALAIARAGRRAGDHPRRRLERAGERRGGSRHRRSGCAAGRSALDGSAACEPTPASTLNSLVRWTIGRGLAGLEAWAGTPGTVGGAVFGNAHYGGRSIGERVATVRLRRARAA